MPITNAEWKIMEQLWEKSPRTITELTRSLKENTGWTKQTIITMLRRMEEKGRVKYEESSKAKLFYPTRIAQLAENRRNKGQSQKKRVCRQRMRTWSFPAGMVDENAMCVRT